MPGLPDQWEVLEATDAAHPFRLATSPARNFLNSSFNETATSRRLEGVPRVMVHPADASRLGIGEGDGVVLGNQRGEVRLEATLFDGVQPGVLISEGLMPNSAFADGKGINTLTSDDAVAPFGGAAFHDIHVWMRKADAAPRDQAAEGLVEVGALTI
jgi:anaerobic selenocysteine-containing dehydrogenase